LWRGVHGSSFGKEVESRKLKVESRRKEKNLSDKVGTRILVGCPVPFWELLVHTPAVFVRVANKGLTAYGKWKSAKDIENKERS
jgi:hypothetical protein